jgi:hypothetical protein
MKYFVFEAWEGRFGNNIVQLLIGICMVLQNQMDGLIFPPHEFLNSTKINVSDCTLDSKENDEYFKLDGGAVYLSYSENKFKYHINPRKIFDKYISPIININRENLRHRFLLYSRGEDAFSKNYWNVKVGYTHPPYYYYKKCMELENISKNIKLISQDLLNPVAFYMVTNKIVTWKPRNFREDIEDLLNCEILILECTTLIYFILLFSKTIKKVYLPRPVYDATKNCWGFSHMDIDEIKGNIEIIIIELPEWPKYGEFCHCQDTYNRMITYSPI